MTCGTCGRHYMSAAEEDQGIKCRCHVHCPCRGGCFPGCGCDRAAFPTGERTRKTRPLLSTGVPVVHHGVRIGRVSRVFENDMVEIVFTKEGIQLGLDDKLPRDGVTPAPEPPPVPEAPPPAPPPLAPSPPPGLVLRGPAFENTACPKCGGTLYRRAMAKAGQVLGDQVCLGCNERTSA